MIRELLNKLTEKYERGKLILVLSLLFAIFMAPVTLFMSGTDIFPPTQAPVDNIIFIDGLQCVNATNYVICAPEYSGISADGNYHIDWWFENKWQETQLDLMVVSPKPLDSQSSFIVEKLANTSYIKKYKRYCEDDYGWLEQNVLFYCNMTVEDINGTYDVYYEKEVPPEHYLDLSNHPSNATIYWNETIQKEELKEFDLTSSFNAITVDQWVSLYPAFPENAFRQYGNYTYFVADQTIQKLRHDVEMVVSVSENKTPLKYTILLYHRDTETMFVLDPTIIDSKTFTVDQDWENTTKYNVTTTNDDIRLSIIEGSSYTFDFTGADNESFFMIYQNPSYQPVPDYSNDYFTASTNRELTVAREINKTRNGINITFDGYCWLGGEVYGRFGVGITNDTNPSSPYHKFMASFACDNQLMEFGDDGGGFIDTSCSASITKDAWDTYHIYIHENGTMDVWDATDTLACSYDYGNIDDSRIYVTMMAYRNWDYVDNVIVNGEKYSTGKIEDFPGWCPQNSNYIDNTTITMTGDASFSHSSDNSTFTDVSLTDGTNVVQLDYASDACLYYKFTLNDTSTQVEDYTIYEQEPIPASGITIFDEDWNETTISSGTQITGYANVTASNGDVDVVIFEVEFPNGTKKNFTGVRQP